MSHKAVLQSIQGTIDSKVAITLKAVNLATLAVSQSTTYTAASYDPAQAAEIGAQLCAQADAADAAEAVYQDIINRLNAGEEIVLATSPNGA